ncbi:MAG: zf-HC2 domain-containing protein [bacterium]
MTGEQEGVHPDEGMIHAWLDNALDAADAARLEAHVATCASCAERVAEARGLIAGATRVVGLLDEEPTPLLMPAATPTAGRDLSVWRLLRVTPARASIAALLVVAVGLVLTRSYLGVGSGMRDTSTMISSSAPASSPAPSAEALAMHDTVLDSAVARRLSVEQPPRTVEAAPGVAIPTAPAEPGIVPPRDFGSAASKVLAGRASIRAQRETTTVSADRTRAGMGQLSARANLAEVTVSAAAIAADSVGRAPRRMQGKALARAIAPRECYRLESVAPAVWGSDPLPLILAMDSSATDARVLSASGAETEARAYLEHNGTDSTFFRLRRIGFVGSLTLAGNGPVHAGTLRSAAAGGAATAPASGLAAKGSPTAEPVRDARGAAALVKVTAHKVSCPGS